MVILFEESRGRETGWGSGKAGEETSPRIHALLWRKEGKEKEVNGDDLRGCCEEVAYAWCRHIENRRSDTSAVSAIFGAV